MVTEKDDLYSLWLIPEDDAHNLYSEVIRKLSHTYHTSLFEPHITLLSSITGSKAELIAKTEMLSRHLTRIFVKPHGIKYLNEIYRSLFILITSNEELINANKLAKELFGLPLDEEFMPHLSLLYGNLPVKEKEKIKEKLDSKLLASFHVDNIVLFCTSNESDKWYPVQSFPLVTKV